MQWLVEAGLICKVSLITTPKIPLAAYADVSAFKIYLADVGLLGAMTGLSAKTVVHSHELFQEFRGALTENYVAQELISHRLIPYYWTSEGKAELDFVIQYEDVIFPLEIKFGNSTKKKSLKVYADTYHPKICIRVSPMNLKKDGNLLNCPLYLLEKLFEGSSGIDLYEK